MISVWGLLKGRRGAWWVVAIIFILNAIGNISRIALGGIEGIEIAAALLFHLTQPNVRKFFQKYEGSYVKIRRY
ncbi:MAG: hypothetical protein ACXVHS_06275 [Methanobacterium sp.]